MSDAKAQAPSPARWYAPPTTAPTLKEALELVTCELTTATTCRDFYAGQAHRHRVLHRFEDAAFEQSTADRWTRRIAVLAKLAGLIDLALADPETLARLKAVADEKRKRESADRESAAARQDAGGATA
jgi:hypothetical protein